MVPKNRRVWQTCHQAADAYDRRAAEAALAIFRDSATGRLAPRTIEQRGHVIGMCFFDSEDINQDAADGRVILAKKGNEVVLALDGYAFGNQVFLDHLAQRGAGDIFGSPCSCTVGLASLSVCSISWPACSKNSATTASG